ncbi:MAG: isochorismatase family protein, partial [Akkermansiaceae bacterium]|nr:isochorismatase family protein [Akkermansiaceae bacterium]
MFLARARAGLAILPGLIAVPLLFAEPLELQSRYRMEDSPGSGRFEVVQEPLRWEGSETAIIICDMWDQHWCKGATARVAEMAPRMNEVVRIARQRGVLVIHCPSGTMDFYKDTPQRRLARAAPRVEPRVPLESWCSLDPKREAPLPIDDADNGCDDWPRCDTKGRPERQIAAIEIAPEDAITDSAEAYYLLRQRGIRNVIVMGVHTNMCVLGRPFSIRQMVRQGMNVVLMRDLTDTMYNSRQAPYVSHFAGTDLVVEHIEKFWCPSITSSDFVGGTPFRFQADQRPKVVFIIG